MCSHLTAALSVEHKDLLAPLWKALCEKYDLQFSEYSFANNFLFRKKHSYVFVGTNPPFLRGEFKPGHYYYIPTSPPNEIQQDTIECLKEKSAILYPIPDQWLDCFQHLHPKFSYCRSDSDYMFTDEKLKTLSGRALSSRRNLLAQLKTSHHMESKELTHENIQEAFVILDAWQESSNQTKEASDYWPCRDALEYFTALRLFGRVIYSDDQPVGFSIGENLSSKTVQMVFAKTLHSVKGATPYLYQDFATHVPETVEWLNLEQDLGIPSLRQSKEAYVPDKLLKKWRVTLSS